MPAGLDRKGGFSRRVSRRLLTRLPDGISEPAVVMGTAVLVGIATGFAALLFRQLITTVSTVSFGTVRGWLLPVYPLALILLPALGGALVGQLTTRWAPEARGPGIPEVMEAVALHRGHIRARAAAAKALTASICIGTGGSAGREGPIAHIGSSLGSTIGRLLRLPDRQVQNLVACGAAGGIAATFNAPIAGSLFALEVILGHFSAAYFSSVVISAVVADVIANRFLGDTRAFPVPGHSFAHPAELILFALLGLLAGFVAVAFVRLLDLSNALWDRLSVPLAFKPMLGGALLGVLGVLGVLGLNQEGIPRFFGVGYSTITDALFGNLTLPVLAGLLLLKMIATALTLGSGGSGGVFAPSLFIGAMLGGAFGLLSQALFPTITTSSGAYALVGMAAFISGAVHTPVTIIIMLFELTGNYQIILPLMLATVMSTISSRLSGHESLYTSELSRRGVHLYRGQGIDVMQGITVREGMSEPEVTVSLSMTLPELARTFEETHSHGFPVLDEDGLLAGVVSLGDYERAVGTGVGEAKLVADIATRDGVLVTYPDEPMSEALRRIALRDISRLPVVSHPGSRQLVGIIRRADIIRAYSRAQMKRARYQHRLEQLSLEKVDDAKFAQIEIFPRAWAAGRRLGEIPRPDGCLFVSVRRGHRLHVAQPQTILQPGDTITLFGRPESVSRLRSRLTGFPDRDPHQTLEPEHRELEIPAGARCCNTPIRDLTLPEECLVVSIEREGEVLVAHGHTRLRAGDVVELFGLPGDLDAAEALLSRR